MAAKTFRVGDRIEAVYSKDGKWYGGQITGVKLVPTYNILWDDAGRAQGKPSSEVRREKAVKQRKVLNFEKLDGQTEWKVVKDGGVCVKAALKKVFLKKDDVVEVAGVDATNRTLSITKPCVGTVIYQLENGTDLLSPSIETQWVVIKPTACKRALGRQLLQKDTEVRVVEVDDTKKRVQIDSPCKGWCSYQTKSGETLIMAKSALEKIRRKRKQSTELTPESAGGTDEKTEVAAS